ncbi:hypothetical protein HN51_055592, partial [Arachis hypogaea]
GGKYIEEDTKAVLRQILNVVAFCHLQNVVHHDLKKIQTLNDIVGSACFESFRKEAKFH